MFIDPYADQEQYFWDVYIQTYAQEFAHLFNQYDVPKKVTFLECTVLELTERMNDIDTSTFPHPLVAIERFLSGPYIKHNNNWDWKDNTVERSTPQAFSHFTYEASAEKLLVCDIQGVQDVYTDPQIHTVDKSFGQGNHGKLGIAKFFQKHRCNAI
eukprot:UN31465